MGRYLGRPVTTTEAISIIVMVQYYRDICPRWSQILSPLTEAASCPKYSFVCGIMNLEIYLKELKCMVSSETLIIYPDWKMTFTFHTDAYDKQLGAVISKN